MPNNKEIGKYHHAKSTQFTLSRIAARVRQLNESIADYKELFSEIEEEQFLESFLYTEEETAIKFETSILELEKAVSEANKRFLIMSHLTSDHI